MGPPVSLGHTVQCARDWESTTSRLRHTSHRPMAWWKVPPATQRLHAGPPGCHQLGVPSTLDPVGPPSCSKRRPQHLLSRTSLWSTTGELLDVQEPPAAIFLEHLCLSPISLPTRPIQSQTSPGLPEKLLLASFVFICKGAPGPPLSPLYEGPYRVVDKNPKFFTLELGGRQEKVSVDRLKPFLAQQVVPAEPPYCGHPPMASS